MVELEYCKSDLLESVKPSRGFSNPVAYIEMVALIKPEVGRLSPQGVA